MSKLRSNRNKKRTRTSKPRKLNVQRLEDRQLMAANIFLNNGVLEVNGTAERDSIEITQEGSQIIASINSSDASIEKSYSVGSVNKVVVRGQAGDDVIVNSTSVRSSLYGGSGDDLIVGGSGDDFISAGNGNDAVYGGSGNDRIFGGNGHDKLYGESGHDTVVAGNGNDQLIGGSGNDQMWGKAGNDALWGGPGADQLVGGSGDDYVAGGSSNDKLWGSDGNDVLDGNSGSDRLEGGYGDDSLFGGSGSDRLYGQNGNDKLSGESGNDSLYGGNGKDDVYGGAGQDYLSGGWGTDRLYGGSGYDWYANRWEAMRSSSNGPQAADLVEPSGRDLSAIPQSRLQRIVDAAIENWDDAGLDNDLVDSLAKAKFRVADLPAGKTATFTRAADGDVTIWIDNDAGGLGWFIDATPNRNEEFVGTSDTLWARDTSVAANRMDLLTVIGHELGHLLGAEHTLDASAFMTSSLGIGLRRVPDAPAAGAVQVASTSVVAVADHRNPWYGQGTRPALFGANFALGPVGFQNVSRLQSIGLNYVGFGPATIFNPFLQNYYATDYTRGITGGGFRWNGNNQTVAQGCMTSPFLSGLFRGMGC